MVRIDRYQEQCPFQTARVRVRAAAVALPSTSLSLPRFWELINLMPGMDHCAPLTLHVSQVNPAAAQKTPRLAHLHLRLRGNDLSKEGFGSGITVTAFWRATIRSYGLDGRGSIPAGARNFSLLHSVRIGSEAHPASSLVSTGGILPEGKSVRA
jgi:hypothetical protein